MKWSIPAMSFMWFVAGVVGTAAHSPQPLRAADRLVVYAGHEANVTDPEGTVLRSNHRQYDCRV